MANVAHMSDALSAGSASLVVMPRVGALSAGRPSADRGVTGNFAAFAETLAEQETRSGRCWELERAIARESGAELQGPDSPGSEGACGAADGAGLPDSQAATADAAVQRAESSASPPQSLGGCSGLCVDAAARLASQRAAAVVERSLEEKLRLLELQRRINQARCQQFVRQLEASMQAQAEAEAEGSRPFPQMSGFQRPHSSGASNPASWQWAARQSPAMEGVDELAGEASSPRSAEAPDGPVLLDSGSAEARRRQRRLRARSMGQWSGELLPAAAGSVLQASGYYGRQLSLSSLSRAGRPSKSADLSALWESPARHGMRRSSSLSLASGSPHAALTPPAGAPLSPATAAVGPTRHRRLRASLPPGSHDGIAILPQRAQPSAAPGSLPDESLLSRGSPRKTALRGGPPPAGGSHGRMRLIRSGSSVAALALEGGSGGSPMERMSTLPTHSSRHRLSGRG